MRKTLTLAAAFICAATITQGAVARAASTPTVVSDANGQCTIRLPVLRGVKASLVGQCVNLANTGLLERSSESEYAVSPASSAATREDFISATTQVIATTGFYVVWRNTIAGPKMALVTADAKEASRYVRERYDPTMRAGMDAGLSVQLADGVDLSDHSPSFGQWLSQNQ